MAADSPFPYILVAAIVRPQGRHGELLCDLLTDFPEKFAERKHLFLLSESDVDTGLAESAREIALQDFWMPHGKNAGRIVLKFAGCDSIEEAEKLAGFSVAIPTQDRALLNEDEFFIGDLIGCEIVTADGTIGTVQDVDTATAGTTLLTVINAAGEEILIPLVKAYLLKADIPAKRIEMALPKGLVEINRREAKS
jgi:16S rRNA processing protein RimM